MEEEISDKSLSKKGFHLFSFKSKRILIALLLLFGCYCAISMRSHIGVAMVCMINATAVQEISAQQNPPKIINQISRQSECQPLSKIKNDTSNKNSYHGSFVWSTEKQSILFSSSFYGNLAIMCFSGFFVDHFGPKIVALIAVAGMSALTLASPTMAYLNFYDFVGLRVIFGIFENSFYPTMSAMASRWFPLSERSTASAIFISGNQLATSLGVVIASELCTLEIFDGWPLIFYLAGFLGIIWIGIWCFWASDSPADSKFLSSAEKEFLHEEIGQHFKTPKERKISGQTVPLRQMLISNSVLAILAAQFAFNFSNTLIITYLPTYVRDVLALDLKQNGFYTALPFIFQFFSQIGSGVFADFLKQKNILSPSSACRLFQAFASFGVTVIFISMGFYVDCMENKLALILLIAYGITSGATISGSFTASLCVASPMFTGMLASFVLISAAIANSLAPALVFFVVKQGTKLEWSIVFGITAVINCLGGCIFLVYGTAKIERWALPRERAPVIMVTQCSIAEVPENPNDSIHHLTIH